MDTQVANQAGMKINRRTAWTQERSLTRRGVLWLGLKCDVRCKFCYDENLEKEDKIWVDLDGVKRALERFRRFYLNRFVDFMGGEPTLYPHIIETVEYCNQIGLAPTCITHGMHLTDRDNVMRFKRAGIHDFLVSIHGIGAVVDQIHGNGHGNFTKQLRALANLREEQIPVRFNVTMIEDNMRQLPQIATLAKDVGASVINFLTFNPYFEWRERGAIPFQAKHTEIVPYLKEAIDVCNANGIEANVRYMPLCLMKGYEKHVYTGFQLPYDPHEWDYNSWYDRLQGGAPDRDWYYEASIKQRERHSYEYASDCNACAAKGICDGFHAQYLGRWGDGEVAPYTGEPVGDPTHFIRGQWKLTYVADESAEPESHADTPRLLSLPLTQFQESTDHRAGVRSKVENE